MKFMHGHSNDDGPCRHMEKLLQDAAASNSRGLARWYALAHAARCGKCGKFLASLQSMIGMLRSERNAQTDDDALARLRAKLHDSGAS